MRSGKWVHWMFFTIENRVMDRTGHGVPPAATIAAREISLVQVRARIADTDS